MPSSTLEEARALADLDVPAPSRASAQEFALGGAIPRAEPQERRGFKSQDVFLRLENKVYGPLTQDELGDLLESGQLTGFESASSDLRTWTPLIYHPRMTLNGQIDPDATHDLLHGRSDLPAAGSRPVSVNLEELADLEEDEEIPGTPLAAILIMPSGPLATPKTLAPKKSAPAKAATSLDAPVFADLDEEDLDAVIVRSGVPADDANDELADTSENIPTTEAKAEPPPEPDAPPPAPPAPVAAAASPPPPPSPAEAPASSAEPDDAGSTMSLSPVEAMQVLADIGAAIPPAPPIDILDDDDDPLPVDASAFGDTIERAVIQDDGDDEQTEDDAVAAAVTAPLDVGEPSQEAAQGEQSASAPEEEDDGGRTPRPSRSRLSRAWTSSPRRPAAANQPPRTKKPPAGVARAEGSYTSENSELIFFTSEHEAVKRASEEVQVKEERIGPSNKHYLAAMIVLVVVALAAVIFLTDIFNLTG